MEYVLSIKQIYLDLIKNDIKTHEYRLASPDRRKIQVDDTLVLKSDSDLLKVRVTDIHIAPTWEEALKDRYQKDFNGVYSSLEETIEACNKFYPLDQVKKYGIIIYTISK